MMTSLLKTGRFIFGFAVIAVLSFPSVSIAGGMSGGGGGGGGGGMSSCTIPNPLVSGSMGTDVEEYATQPYCYIGPEMCCDSTSVPQITQTYFDEYRKRFIMDSFYTCPVEIDFQKETDDVRNGFAFEIGAIGALIDASILLDNMRALQSSQVETMKDYTVSDQICRFGTLSRSLSASEERVDANRLVLSEQGLARNLGTVSTIATAGRGQDNESRLRMFIEQYCDLTDNESGMAGLCQTATPVISLNLNMDIDYTRTIDSKLTVNADFTNTSKTQDESNVIALGHYLYGHRQPSKRISYADMEESMSSQPLYREYRSVYARRAAAQNTYNTLAAMRAAGSGGSDAYMTQALQNLGLSSADLDRYIGDKDSKTAKAKSSYNSQMEVLAKTLYQDPAFYANLMESKTNVSRASAAMQGIGLMQGRDIYRSTQRSEMLLAILVELEAKKLVNNNLGVKGEGK